MRGQNFSNIIWSFATLKIPHALYETTVWGKWWYVAHPIAFVTLKSYHTTKYVPIKVVHKSNIGKNMVLPLTPSIWEDD